jgi:hypothetical protein
MKKLIFKSYCKIILFFIRIRIQIVSNNLEFLEEQGLNTGHKKEKLSYLFQKKFKYEFILSIL